MASSPALGNVGALVEREQHRAEQRAAVGVELRAERGRQLVLGARRVLLTPLRYYDAGPLQVGGLVLTEPHRVPSPAIIPTAAFFRDVGHDLSLLGARPGVNFPSPRARMTSLSLLA